MSRSDLPTLNSRAVVRLVLLQLAARGIVPRAGEAGLAKAGEAAGRLLRALDVEDSADPFAVVVDFDAYRLARAVRRA